MYLPELNQIPSRVMELNEFRGINDTFYIPEGYFKDMKNMSSDYYPVLGPRKQRDIYKVNGKINGVVVSNGDVYMAVGTGLYKNGEIIDSVELEDSTKRMLAYGTYIVIMPDKMLYNTSDNAVVKLDFEAELTQKQLDKESYWGNSTSLIYVSDKDSNPFVDCSMYISDNNIKEWLDTVKYPATATKAIPYGNNYGAVSSYIKNNGYYEDDGSSPYYLSWNNEEKTALMETCSITDDEAMMTPVDLYLTLLINADSDTEAQSIEESLKAGDYITLKVTSNGKELDESNGEKYVDLLKQLKKGVRIEYIKRSGSVVAITFPNTGIDYLSWAYKQGYLKISNNKNAPNITTPVYLARLQTAINIPYRTTQKLVMERSIPTMDFMTVSNNRIWGCSSDKHEIYASKLGDPTNWNCFAGLANDSYAVTIGSDGDFTGACTYRGEPYFFKEDLVICMYGTKPANYQVSEIYYAGPEKGSSDSICFLDGVMYYKTRNGIVRFDGSSTSLISEELGNKVFKNAKACADDKKYFVSMEADGEAFLYVYDSTKGLWHKEDGLCPDVLFRKRGSVFAVTNEEESIIQRISGLDELNVQGIVTEKAEEVPEYELVEDIKIYNRGINWSAETGPIESGSVEHKYIQKLGMRYEIKERASLTVSVKYDNEEDWIHIFTRQGKKGEGATNITFKPRRCEKFRLRFEGEGESYIYALRRIVNEGSDKRYGNI